MNEERETGPLPGSLEAERTVEVRFFLSDDQLRRLEKLDLPTTPKEPGTETSGDIILGEQVRNSQDKSMPFFAPGFDAMSLLYELQDEGFGLSYTRLDLHSDWKVLVLEFRSGHSGRVSEVLWEPAMSRVLRSTFQQFEAKVNPRGAVQQVITFGRQRGGNPGYGLAFDPETGWTLIPKRHSGESNGVQACA